MAEVIGIAASIVQLVNLGFSTADKLYNVADLLKTNSSQIQRLAQYVRQNCRLFERLKNALEEDEAASIRINNDLKEDISSVVNTCDDIIRCLAKAVEDVSVDGETKARAFLARYSKKARYILYDKETVDKLRNELSQCETTLHLMLVIRWRPEALRRRELGKVFDENSFGNSLLEILEVLRSSNVPAIAEAVNEFLIKISNIQTDSGYQSSKTSDSFSQTNSLESKNLKLYTPQTSSSVKAYLPNAGNSTAASLDHNDCCQSPQSTLERTMWSGSRGPQWKFETVPVSRSSVAEFVTANAAVLLDRLAELDSETSLAVRKHVQGLQETLLALHTRRQQRVSLRKQGPVISMNFVTERQWPKSGSGPAIQPIALGNQKSECDLERQATRTESMNEAVQSRIQACDMSRPEINSGEPIAELSKRLLHSDVHVNMVLPIDNSEAAVNVFRDDSLRQTRSWLPSKRKSEQEHSASPESSRKLYKGASQRNADRSSLMNSVQYDVHSGQWYSPNYRVSLPPMKTMDPLQSASSRRFQEVPALEPLPTTNANYVGVMGYPLPMPLQGPKAKFTPEEDALLLKLKEEYTKPKLSWTQIADFFPGRKSGTLQVRYCTKLRKKDAFNWTVEFDEQLKEAAQEVETEKWTQISSKLNNRISANQCRDRLEMLEAGDLAKQGESSTFPMNKPLMFSNSSMCQKLSVNRYFSDPVPQDTKSYVYNSEEESISNLPLLSHTVSNDEAEEKIQLTPSDLNVPPRREKGKMLAPPSDPKEVTSSTTEASEAAGPKILFKREDPDVKNDTDQTALPEAYPQTDNQDATRVDEKVLPAEFECFLDQLMDSLSQRWNS